MAGPPLAGKRVLIVEDEAVIALMIEDMVTDLGGTVVASIGRLDAALDMARSAPMDLAILDVNLGGEPAWGVADALAARGIPFVFGTGYDAAGIAEGYRAIPALQKPFGPDQLVAALGAALAQG